MTVEALSAAASACADGETDLAAFRWMRPLAVAAIAVVVTAAFNTHPAPGVNGEHLAVSVVLVQLDDEGLERAFRLLSSEGIRDVRHVRNETELADLCNSRLQRSAPYQLA